YQIRLHNVFSPETPILFVTERIFLLKMLCNPRLDGIAGLFFDEFHERHLFSDVSLARALELQDAARPDLKIIVMSATLESAQLERYLAPCEVLSSEGRTYPVEIEHTRHEPREAPPWG